MVAGKKLKAKSGWYQNANGTDEYGFSGLPGGYHSSSGFKYVGNYGYWWTATATGSSSSSAYDRFMYYNYDYTGDDSSDKSYGFSVRCVADQ